MNKDFVTILAALVFGLCVYAFLLANNLFKGEFSNEPLSWYILAKGMYCAATLVLFQRILNAIEKK
jgi:hypothetical protein